MYQEYKPRHPLAWGIIAGVALFSAVAIGAMQGWLPTTDSRLAVQACTECGFVESVRTVETPVVAIEPELKSTEVLADGNDVTPVTPPETVAQVAHSYETTVRLEDGTTSVFSQAELPSWQAGDKVRVVDGVILVSG